MNKAILTLLLLSSYAGFCQVDQSSYPDFVGMSLNAVENSLEWNVLDAASGDLNKDGYEDHVVILELKKPILEKRCANCKSLKTKPRIILVLKQLQDEQQVVLQNNAFIARDEDGGMSPHLEPVLSIENGKLTVFYQFTRASLSYTFEFHERQLLLIKAASNGVHDAKGNYTIDRFDFVNSTLTSETGNIAETSSKTVTIDIPTKLKSLSSLGEIYSWEVIENKFL